MIEHIIGVLAPHECISCRSEGMLLCLSCRHGLPVAATSLPWIYKGYLCAATAYEGPAKDLVYRFKFERARAAARVMALVMADRLPSSNIEAVTNVPTATARQRTRGYDQASLIAKELAGLLGVRYLPFLERIGQQRQLGRGRNERQQQLIGVFRPVHVEMVRDRRVLLVDDVLTTGSTLNAAAGTLMQAGANSVSACVFARA